MTEWTELPDLPSVAKAVTDGWEIEFLQHGVWTRWTGNNWSKDGPFRGRPKQPRMKKVVSECWRHQLNGNLSWGTGFNCGNWQRFSAGDFTGEVEDV